MILDNFSFVNSDPLCEFAHDICNCDDIVDNPFEYIIRSIYENQMIIEDMNMSIISEEYTYLKENGTEPVFVGEAGIIGTIFGSLFKLLGNAFKAICSFFKSIFNRNKSTIESASKEIKETSDEVHKKTSK